MSEFKNLEFHLQWLAGQGTNEQVAVVYHNLCIPDTVTSCGRVQLHLDDAEYLHDSERLVHFDIQLGPVNAMKLIEFLKQLPDEPDDTGGSNAR